MEKHLSNAQIDRLGDRLRRKDFGEADLRLLDEFRRSFGPAYDDVVKRIQRITLFLIDPSIKYGGGPDPGRSALQDMSRALEGAEELESQFHAARRELLNNLRSTVKGLNDLLT